MYCQYWTRGLSQNPFCHGPHHQPVKPSPAVSSHDDQIHFLRVGKREYRVCRHSLPHHSFRLNLTVRMALHELLELLLTSVEKVSSKLLLIAQRGEDRLRISPQLSDLLYKQPT